MKTTCVWVGAAILLAFPLTARPQQPGDSITTALLNDVVVTANKVQQKQSQTGKVVSVITRAQLEKQAGRSLGQVLNEQAGIVIPGALNSPGSPQTLSVRGAGPGRTLILIDGIPAFDPSLINSEFDLNLMNLNDIQRIEIARGAQSTLYGSDAIGGVVNIITTRPGISKPFHLKATGIIGNLATYKGNLQLYGKAGKLSYNARYSHIRTNGFSAAHDKAGNQNFDRDGYNGQHLAASVQYQVSQYWSVKSFVQRNLYRADADGGVFADDRDFTIDNKNTLAGTGFQYKKGKLALTANYQYSDIRRNYLNDSGHISGFATFVTDDYMGKNQFAELYGSIKFHESFTLVAGVDYRFNSMNSRYFSLSSFGPFASRFSDTSVHQTALFASGIFSKRKLNIELGGRLNSHKQYGTNSTFTFNPSLQVHKHFRVFGSIASAFKAPSLYQLYASFGNPHLNAETAITYETGIQFSKSQTAHRIVFFHRNTRNGIDFDNIRFSYFNFNRQRVNGVEWEGRVALSQKLAISGNYTLLLGREKTQSRITAKDTSYTYLLRRPRHNANISISYNPLKQWDISVGGKWVSARRDAGGYQTADVKLDGYFLLNAFTSYRFTDRLKAFAEAQNMLQQRFFDVNGYNTIPFLVNAGFTIDL